jgi:outer membrane receptor protein involved in Fe transport
MKLQFRLALLFILIRSMVMFAQGIGSTSGTLRGIVNDESGAPLANVSITISGQNGSKNAATDSSGRFIFPYITPALYTIRVELHGFSTVEQQDVRIALAQQVEMNFILKKSIQESVTVLDQPPFLDPTNTVVGANISDAFVQKIPIGRSLADIIFIAPGVSDAGIGGANLSVSGGSGLENTYIVDGANVTTPGFGAAGSYSGIHGALGGNLLPVEMIKEVQVKTAGFEPEFGEATGGVINVITKSGGNNLRGSAYIYFTPQSAADKISRGDYGADTGFDVGGPVLKDKLFFFGAYNYNSYQFTYFNDPANPSYDALPQYANKTITNSYSFKIDSNLTKNQTLQFSVTGDPSYRPLTNQDGLGVDSYPDPTMRQSEWRYGTNSQVLRWNDIFNSGTFIEAQVARAHDSFVEIPATKSQKLSRIVDHTAGGIDIGGFGGYRNFYGTNWQYSLKFTNLWKSHQFHYGIEYQDISFSQLFARTGSAFTTFTGQLSTTGYKEDIVRSDEGELQYQVDAALSSPLTTTTTNYVDWFAQDSWSISSYLNVMLGVRWERQHLQGNEEGATAVTFTDNWAPRVGATYDFLRNGKSKLFFNFGHFFEKMPNYMGVFFTGNTFAEASYSDPELTQLLPGSMIAFTPPAEVEGSGSSSSPYRTRAQYQTEWTAGIEQELKTGFGVSAHFISRDLKRVTEGILVNPDLCTPSSGGCVPTAVTAEQIAKGMSYVPLISNVDGHIAGIPRLVRQYRAVELTLQQQFSKRWLVLGSYRYARLIGNYEGLFSRESDLQFPNVTSAGDLAVSPFLQYNYVKGPLPNDIRNMVKLFGSYQWRDNFNTSAAFYFQTGRPITEIGIIDYLDADRVRLMTPRGALGRTDHISSLDLHTDYGFTIDRGQGVTVGIDVFNVFNSHGVTAIDEINQFYDTNLQPEFDNPTYTAPQYQAARSFRLVLRYSF